MQRECVVAAKGALSPLSLREGTGASLPHTAMCEVLLPSFHLVTLPNTVYLRSTNIGVR